MTTSTLSSHKKKSSPQPKPATWIYVQGGNDCYWRVEMPAKHIGAKLIRIPEESGGFDLTDPNMDRDFRWQLTEDGAEYPDLEGTAVFTRPCDYRTVHAIAMRDNYGCRIVAELDDNYVAPGKFNLAIRDWDDPGLIKGTHMAILLYYDAIIFSTEWLRDRYVKEYRKELRLRAKHLPELHIAGNHIDPDDWPKRSPMRKDGKLRVGWMGSPSHIWDLKMAYPALLAAHRLGHEVVIIGFDPHWRPEDTYISGVRPQYPFEYTYIPWKNPLDYGRPEIGLPLDIAIAPLTHDEFNLGRSDVKALEYGISGAAVVASQTVYNRTLVHGETALLGQSREEHEQNVLRLIADDTLRENLAGNLAQYIREERLIQHHINDWRNAICPP